MQIINDIIFLQISAQTVQDLTSVLTSTVSSPSQTAIDWNFIISTVVITAGVLVAIIQLFGPLVSVKDETLRKSKYIEDMQNSINKTNEKMDIKSKDIVDKIDSKIKDLNISIYERIDDKITIVDETIENIDEKIEGLKEELQEIKNQINTIKTDISRLEFQGKSQEKMLEDIKREQRQLVERMDNILRQMLDLL